MNPDGAWMSKTMSEQPKIKGELTKEDEELYTVLHYMVASGEDISNFAKELKGESTDQYIDMIHRLSNEQKQALFETVQKIRKVRNLLQEIIDNK